MGRQKQNLKIILAISTSLLLVFLISKNFLFSGTPRLRQINFLSLLFGQKLKITPPPSPAGSTSPFFLSLTPSTTPVFLPAATISPASIPSAFVTQLTILPTATVFYTPTAAPRPTQISSFACPAVSPQNYNSLSTRKGAPIAPSPDGNPEVNLYLRGFTRVNENTNLINRSDNYGLDFKMPPQISTLFGGRYPKIVSTYRIFEWDFQNHKSLAPQPATPNFEVHMVGLATKPGEPLFGLQAGREIGEGNVFMVVHATADYILFTHSRDDGFFDGYLTEGYLFYFLDICTDPNLLAVYQRDSSKGRNQLPVIAPGQIFGYAKNNEVKVVIRDSMSFMDPRYRQDWWDWGK